MAKYDSFDYQYTLLLLNAQEQVLSGLTSNRDMSGTQRLAQSILHLDSRVAFVDIHHFVAHAAALGNCEPLARLSLDNVAEE